MNFFGNAEKNNYLKRHKKYVFWEHMTDFESRFTPLLIKDIINDKSKIYYLLDFGFYIALKERQCSAGTLIEHNKQY